MTDYKKFLDDMLAGRRDPTPDQPPPPQPQPTPDPPEPPPERIYFGMWLRIFIVGMIAYMLLQQTPYHTLIALGFAGCLIWSFISRPYFTTTPQPFTASRGIMILATLVATYFLLADLSNPPLPIPLTILLAVLAILSSIFVA
jgi:hypothetical protein